MSQKWAVKKEKNRTKGIILNYLSNCRKSLLNPSFNYKKRGNKGVSYYQKKRFLPNPLMTCTECIVNTSLVLSAPLLHHYLVPNGHTVLPTIGNSFIRIEMELDSR